MEFDEIHRRLLEIESETGIFDVEVNGIPVWERIRFNVHRQLMYALDEWEHEEPEPNTSLANYVQKLWLCGRNVFIRNPFLANSHEVLYWGHHRRKKHDDGYWWDIYTDPIHEKIEQDYLQVEIPHFNEHHTPARTGNLRYLDLIQISAGIQRRLGIHDASFSARERGQITRVSDRLEEEFEVDIDVLGLVRDMLVDRAALKPLYHRFLERVNPAIAIIVIHNGKETFVETCQEREIPVVELQQAILNKYEYAYSFPGERMKQAFPDYLFTWGEFWNEQAAYPIPDHRVIEVGYPYLEMSAKEQSNISTRDQVLFISQPNIGEELTRTAVEVASDSTLDSEIVYKLHPHEYDGWREQYPWLKNSPVTVVGSQTESLYELLAASRAQVGVFSTALYEGLYFGLDTYLMDFPGVEHLANLYTDGPAILVESSPELVTHLHKHLGGDVSAHRFFKPGAVTNIEREIREICSQGDLSI